MTGEFKKLESWRRESPVLRTALLGAILWFGGGYVYSEGKSQVQSTVAEYICPAPEAARLDSRRFDDRAFYDDRRYEQDRAPRRDERAAPEQRRDDPAPDRRATQPVRDDEPVRRPRQDRDFEDIRVIEGSGEGAPSQRLPAE